MNVPQPCIDAACPLAPRAKGFALPSGNLQTAKMALLLEMPGDTEHGFLVRELVDGEAELQRRRTLYPSLETKFVNIGAPVVGRAGYFLWTNLMSPLGLQRTDVAIFNVCQCACGKDADGTFFYPKGAERKRAEATCAELWLQPLLSWHPTVSVVGMHPSALVRDITPLPMVLRAIEKAKQFYLAGERVLLLLGGKAAKHWLGYAENTTRFVIHHQHESDLTYRLRQERWDKGRHLSVTKEKRVKKFRWTAQKALAFFLAASTPIDGGFRITADITTEYMDELVRLTTKKGTKVPLQ